MEFIYGTAWKEEKTADLVLQALQVGFRAIDTANQRKHYHEQGVGEGLKRFLTTTGLSRSEIFIQTKFTFLRGQDHRLPYDEGALIATQVEQSFQSSLKHLGLDYLDSLVLHGPFSGHGLTVEDWDAWGAMENIHRVRKTKHLGVSNFSASQLSALLEKSKVKPDFVQNRCYARLGWDRQVREICNRYSIGYQGFSLLTANQNELEMPLVLSLSKKYGKTPSQIIFRFSQQVGMIPLTGSSSHHHLKQDLNILDFTLTAKEVEAIEKVSN